jgi:hypothetical protein
MAIGASVLRLALLGLIGAWVRKRPVMFDNRRQIPAVDPTLAVGAADEMFGLVAQRIEGLA